MASPGSFTAGQVLTAAEMNALPGAVMAYERNTSPGGLSTSSATFESVTFTAVSGRLYLAVGALISFGYSAAACLSLKVETGGTRFGESIWAVPNTTQDFVGGTVSGYFTASGSTTVDLTAVLFLGGAVTASVNTTGDSDPYLLVLDVGPS